MNVIELTHTIQGDMPVYPGTEQPVLTTACTIREAGYRETLLHMYSHTGTHMDAPAHMIEGGKTLDTFPAEAFVGPGLALDCRGLREIPLSLLRLWSGWLFGVLLAVMVLIPAVYSYALHRKGI